MTPGQQAVVVYVSDYAARHGYAPTFRELAKGLGVALATVRQRVRALERAGRLSHEDGVCRSLRVV